MKSGPHSSERVVCFLAVADFETRTQTRSSSERIEQKSLLKPTLNHGHLTSEYIEILFLLLYLTFFLYFSFIFGMVLCSGLCKKTRSVAFMSRGVFSEGRTSICGRRYVVCETSRPFQTYVRNIFFCFLNVEFEGKTHM